MSQVATIGLDIDENVFHAHGADERVQRFHPQVEQGKAAQLFCQAGSMYCGARSVRRRASLGA